jgi:hypothetical protein
MKSLNEFKQEPTLIEEEKSDYSKFDALVRAGLANKAQLNRIHRILDKMGEERPQFNNADREILRNLFNKMADVITNNKQIYQKARQVVREDSEVQAEGIIDTIDYKISPTGRKVRAHRLKIGDTDPNMRDAEKDDIKEATDSGREPPFMLVLKRTGIRIYPTGLKVAVYYNQKMDKYFSVPYGDGVNAAIQAEQIGMMDQLQQIAESKESKKVNFANGKSTVVDRYTASAITKVYESVNDDNKEKLKLMVEQSPEEFNKVVQFAFNKVK